MRIKNYLIIVFSIFLLSGCALIELYQGLDEMGNFKPHIATYAHSMEIYGILENGKVNKMGVAKNDVYSVGNKIDDLYGIIFISPSKIYARENSKVKYFIKFYDNFKIQINGKIYIIPKEKIKLIENNPNQGDIFYDFDFPVDLYSSESKEKIKSFIFEVGKIEVISKEGKIIKSRRKIPPLIFKRVKVREKVLDWAGYNTKTYYEGWEENYHEYDESKEK